MELDPRADMEIFLQNLSIKYVMNLHNPYETMI